ncbi:MAG: NUDIX hydrolase [Planctomycetes bacterium]|jgi:8-oxo-dGTP diphosphatase|nr:NUDIX hydrolase [Planctomycetota bacterium]
MTVTYTHPRPMAAADLALFALREGALKTLLVRRGREPFKGRWCFPGGFVEENEDPARTAVRELAEETSLEGIDLEFLRSYGAPGRDPRGHVISHAWFGIVPPDRAEARAGDDAADARWHPAFRPPPLAFDHALMLRDALSRLLERVRNGDGAFRFLPPRFSPGDLRAVFEAVLRRKIPAEGFRKEMERLGVLKPAPGGLVRPCRKTLARRIRESAVFRIG